MTSYTPGDSYPKIELPSYAEPTHTYGSTFGDNFHAPAVLELLASTDGGFTQRGVILAGGQGVLPTGTVLAQYTSGPNQYAYGVYSDSGSNGLNTPLGFLRNGVDTGTVTGVNTGGLLVDRGIVNVAVTSGLTSTAIVKLVGRQDAAVNRFYF
jgi:hypothetical protein